MKCGWCDRCVDVSTVCTLFFFFFFCLYVFFFNDTATTEIYTLSLHDALPILSDEDRNELINLKHKLVLKRSNEKIRVLPQFQNKNSEDYHAVLAEIGVISPCDIPRYAGNRKIRSEEHTSELQSH